MPRKLTDNSGRLPAARRSEHGATVVEFAFIAGVVFLIIFGILEFGLIFLQEHYVANAAREATRIGVRANNFSTYDNNAKRSNCLDPAIESWRCTDRKWRTQRVATDYLDVFYDPTEVNTTVGYGNGSLIVTVNIDAGDIKRSGIIPFANDIEFTTSMEYEDKVEYTREHP